MVIVIDPLSNMCLHAIFLDVFLNVSVTCRHYCCVYVLFLDKNESRIWHFFIKVCY